MLTGEVKQRLVQVLTELVERHRTARANVTEEVHSKLITSFFSINSQSSPQSLERHDIEILNIFKNTKSFDVIIHWRSNMVALYSLK
jgi:hypothetical protein